MRAATTALALSILLAAPAARAADLEAPSARQGYYLGVGGAGLISATRTDDDGWLGVWPGGSGALRVGQAVLPWLDLGLALGIGGARGGERSATLGRFAIEAQVRPFDPLFVRVAAGLGITSLDAREPDVEPIDGRFGDGWTVAAGWDLFPWYDEGSGGLAVTPVAGVSADVDDFFETWTGWVGVELSWWAGLPDNELELPPEEAFRVR